MGDAARALERLVEAELLRPAPESALALAERIRGRCGEAVAAIVFYGSCLRRGSDEGVLDFYVIVDSYRELYASRPLAWLNALLPPNVFYLELEPRARKARGEARPDEVEPLRTKYAVLSARDFERGVAGEMLRPGIWARFCQPLLAVYVRDDAARELLVTGAARAVTTALERIVPLLPPQGDARRFPASVFWERAFRETYGYEMRTETPEATAELYRADRERFDRAAEHGLGALHERGRLEAARENGWLSVRLPGVEARRARRAWRRRRPLAKLVYLLGLAKTTLTFGDWLPYALWKLERHSGTRLVPSARQRRHPLVFGWPLLFRALWRRDFR